MTKIKDDVIVQIRALQTAGLKPAAIAHQLDLKYEG
jgi:hypothetical protein